MSNCAAPKNQGSSERCPHPARYGAYCGLHRTCQIGGGVNGNTAQPPRVLLPNTRRTPWNRPGAVDPISIRIDNVVRALIRHQWPKKHGDVRDDDVQALWPRISQDNLRRVKEALKQIYTENPPAEMRNIYWRERSNVQPGSRAHDQEVVDTDVRARRTLTTIENQLAAFRPSGVYSLDGRTYQTITLPPGTVLLKRLQARSTSGEPVYFIAPPSESKNIISNRNKGREVLNILANSGSMEKVFDNVTLGRMARVSAAHSRRLKQELKERKKNPRKYPESVPPNEVIYNLRRGEFIQEFVIKRSITLVPSAYLSMPVGDEFVGGIYYEPQHRAYLVQLPSVYTRANIVIPTGPPICYALYNQNCISTQHDLLVKDGPYGAETGNRLVPRTTVESAENRKARIREETVELLQQLKGHRWIHLLPQELRAPPMRGDNWLRIDHVNSLRNSVNNIFSVIPPPHYDTVITLTRNSANLDAFYENDQDQAVTGPNADPWIHYYASESFNAQLKKNLDTLKANKNRAAT